MQKNHTILTKICKMFDMLMGSTLLKKKPPTTTKQENHNRKLVNW